MWKFSFTDDEKYQIEEWEKKHNIECIFILNHKDKTTSPYGTIGGGRSYCFTPTAIGVFKTVKCCCGANFTCDSNL